MKANEVKTPVSWEFEKATDSGRRLKEMGWDKQRILNAMDRSGNFNMAVAPRAVDQLFKAERLNAPDPFKVAA